MWDDPVNLMWYVTHVFIPTLTMAGEEPMTAADGTLRTVYDAEDVARARENLRRHDWARELVDRLRSEVAGCDD